MTEWREFTGRTEAVETVESRPRVSRSYPEVHFQSGQLVKKGIFFSRLIRAGTRRSSTKRGGYQQAKVRLETAEREANRTAQLLASKAISTEEGEARRARFRGQKPRCWALKPLAISRNSTWILPGSNPPLTAA